MSSRAANWRSRFWKSAIARLRPGIHRSCRQAFGFVRDDQIEVDRQGVAEPLAFGAGAERIVEGKEPRFRFLVGDVA